MVTQSRLGAMGKLSDWLLVKLPRGRLLPSTLFGLPPMTLSPDNALGILLAGLIQAERHATKSRPVVRRGLRLVGVGSDSSWGKNPGPCEVSLVRVSGGGASSGRRRPLP